MDLADGVVRLLVAAGLSGLIGFEREIRRKDAGMRTHMLIGIGAALFAYVGAVGFAGPGTDLSRIASQVAAGIGFIGAGVIFRAGLVVKGLTTAGGLWVAASLGVAAGVGELGIALAGGAISLAILAGLTPLERAVSRRLASSTVRLRAVLSGEADVEHILDLAIKVDPSADLATATADDGMTRLELDCEAERAEALAGVLRSVDGVESVELTEQSSRRLGS